MVIEHDAPPYATWRTPRDRSLRRFVISALRSARCAVLESSPEDEAPFRVTVRTPDGERLGLLIYAFPVARRRDRPGRHFVMDTDAGRPKLIELYQDPSGLYITLLCGIAPERGLFVGADPVLHSPADVPCAIDFETEDLEEAARTGWHAFLREPVDENGFDEPVEVLVAGTSPSFLRYALFEREAQGEDAGHRELLAERFAPGAGAGMPIGW